MIRFDRLGGHRKTELNKLKPHTKVSNYYSIFKLPFLTKYVQSLLLQNCRMRVKGLIKAEEYLTYIYIKTMGASKFFLTFVKEKVQVNIDLCDSPGFESLYFPTPSRYVTDDIENI